MGLFDKINEPVFLKETSSAENHLSALRNLRECHCDAPKSVLDKIDQEIKSVQAGIFGEQSIAFELKNSHMPMYILHDLFLQHGNLTAQIDYLIVTRRCTFVIECKNLFGNIEIRSNGDFIRSSPQAGKYSRKEGIYSPITQNARHLAIIKEIRRDTKSNVLTKTLFDRNFESNYRSVVVLANAKTVLNAKFAPKEIKQKIIRVDQLIEHIRKTNRDSGLSDCAEKDMTALATFFLNAHQEQADHYIDKFQKLLDEACPPAAEEKTTHEPEQAIPSSEPIPCPKCGAPMVRRVAKFGERAGKAFYGCSKYPACKSIINIDSE